MLQLIGLLVISWSILWLLEKKNLSVLGLTLTYSRFKYVAILFTVAAFFSASAFLMKMYFAKEDYTLNPYLSRNAFLLEVWYQFRTVFTEEIICRGALLYILIKRIGSLRAILISSAIFALLHWFNAGVWGNIFQMVVIFLFTFFMGTLLAFSYARTYSLLIPLAIHFGWNLVQNLIFPDTINGNSLYVLASPPPVVTISYLSFYTMYLLPKFAVIIACYFIVKQYRQVEMP